MDRRTFLGVMAGGLLAAPLAAEGQHPSKVPRVAILMTSTPIALPLGTEPDVFRRACGVCGG